MCTFFSSDILEMTDCCSQEHEGNGDVSMPDDDSVSLLHDLHASQSRGVAEDININEEIHYLNFGNKEQEKKVDVEIYQLKPLDSGMSRCIQSAAGNAESTSQSGMF